MGEKDELKQLATEKGYDTIRRHIFLCTHGKCAPTSESTSLWEYLKKRLKDLEPEPGRASIARSKVGCLRVCDGGVLALVYPEGTLYYDLDETKIDRIIEEHLLGGKPVPEFTFSRAKIF